MSLVMHDKESLFIRPDWGRCTLRATGGRLSDPSPWASRHASTTKERSWTHSVREAVIRGLE